MNPAQQVLFDVLDVTIDGACEAANAEHWSQAQSQFLECARLCQQMDLEQKELREAKDDKQLTIDLQP